MQAMTSRLAAMLPFSVNCWAPTVHTINVMRVPPEPQRKKVRRRKVFIRKQQMVEMMYDYNVTILLMSLVSNSESSPVCFRIRLR